MPESMRHSLVLLLREPQYLDQPILCNAVERTFGADLAGADLTGVDLATPQVYAAPADGIGGSSAARSSSWSTPCPPLSVIGSLSTIGIH